MKNKIAITSAFLAASGLTMAEIKINEFLSFEGFVDMSYSHTDRDLNSGKTSDNSFSIDQVEIDWLFNFGNLTARVDLEHEDGNSVNTDSGTTVEQAFVSYDLGNGVAITAGRYETMLGLEAKEPTGLYQFSRAYATSLGSALDGPFNWFAQGVKATYETDSAFFGLSIQDEAFGYDANRLGGDNDGSWGLEAAGSITSGAITYFLGGSYEDGDGAGDTWLINGHVTYVSGPWTIGAEAFVGESERNAYASNFVSGSSNDELETTGGLLMANYAYNDCSSVTGRISYIEYENKNRDEDQLKYTLAHIYALTDNLAIITELSYAEYERSNGREEEELQGAVEVLFTF